MQITKQRLNNKRFRKTEDEILRIFFEKNGLITIEEIARKMGVARSTIYYHHRRTSEIMADYEEFILKEYNNFTKKDEFLQINKAFYRMLVFIAINRNVFLILLMGKARRAIAEMIRSIKPKMPDSVKKCRDDEMVFEIYIYEIIVVVKKWGETGFLVDRATEVLRDIMYLTSTLRVRLGPLVKN